MDAHVAFERGKDRQTPENASVVVALIQYWEERGHKRQNADQTERSLIVFIAFLMQDEIGQGAVVTDLTNLLFERFIKWRMSAHSYSLTWYGRAKKYSSDGVAGPTVQRNINDVRAAINFAADNMRITSAPKIKNIPRHLQGTHRSRILTEDELARIVWYAAHDKQLFRYVALQIATGVRPMAAAKFDPRVQYNDRSGLIDLQPYAMPQSKKRNAIIPAIRPMRVVLRAWAKDEVKPVESHKGAWRTMRRVLDLTSDVNPKTIRYTIATWLYEMEWVPERQISEVLGHYEEGGRGLARTSRIYAKYRPERMGLVVKGLSQIWLLIFRMARTYGRTHELVGGQSNELLRVVKR
ncbi:MAG: integrase [Alteraurantiacibacter sp.]